jgi:hypothetical protein
MRLKKSITILGKSSRLANEANHKLERWDKAIADAAELIEDAKREQKELERSIRLLTDLRDRGASFPGENVA